MKVLTGPEWLYKMFKGYSNKDKTAYLNPTRDANNKPIIGKSILTDPDFDLTLEVGPEGGEKKAIRDWLIEIDFEPILLEEEEI